MKKAKPEVFLDHYLSTIGLWRKPIPRDGLSLFRAVSEQVHVESIHQTEFVIIIVLHVLKKYREIDII